MSFLMSSIVFSIEFDIAFDIVKWILFLYCIQKGSSDLVISLLLELLSQEGTVKTADALNGKVVGLYFSAHWCPPCRGFTPKLASYYKDDLNAKGLEIVFVSSDKDATQFKDYFGEMPWKALPYEQRDLKEKLSKKFKVQGIPTFVILDSDASIITTSGREAVSEDPKGNDFPWKPKPFWELLGDKFKGKDKEVTKADLDGKVLGLYFSAHWCPPCRGFTPQLAKWYENIKPHGLPFEIIFISSDKDESQFNEYFNEMPWLALPFDERKRKAQLSNHFNVEGIPTFVIVDANGNTINKNGRELPSSDPEGKSFPWHPRPVEDLESGIEVVQEQPAVIAFLESFDKDTQETFIKALEVVAKEEKEAAKAQDRDPVAFLVARKEGRVSPQIRKLVGATNPDAFVTILDLPDNGGYYLQTPVDLSIEGLKSFVEGFNTKSLTRQQLSN